MHKKLDVWNKSVELATEVYRITGKFPEDEKYGLVSQMRRAAVSISSNIAEGAARQTRKEYVHFLFIASGSASELETQIIIARKVGLVDQQRAATLTGSINSVSKMIHGLIKRLKCIVKTES